MNAVLPQPIDPPRLLPLGEAAWTVEFGERIDPELHARVLGLAAALDAAGDREGIIDVVPTFRSLTVHFDPLIVDREGLGARLSRLAQGAGREASRGRAWRLPVCFDEDLAPDLADLAQSKNLRRDEVIALMTGATFQVYMIGFMPGFPYMGGLPKALEMPRLAEPRKAVPARSLAMAGSMCAVYPWESPGGWRLLGRTPLPMFSVEEKEPAWLASGDRVRWQAIDRAAFLDLEAAAAAGQLPRSRFLMTGEAR